MDHQAGDFFAFMYLRAAEQTPQRFLVGGKGRLFLRMIAVPNAGSPTDEYITNRVGVGAFRKDQSRQPMLAIQHRQTRVLQINHH